MEKSKRTWLDLLIIFILGLAPLLWFEAGKLIVSGDMALPLGTAGWKDILYSWNEKIGGGEEKVIPFGALPFFILQFFFYLITHSLRAAQQIEFVVWFMLPGFSMYFLLSKILKGKEWQIGRLVGVSFYMFNLYLEPVWQGKNVANLSAYVVLPVILALFIETLETRKHFLRSSLLIGFLTVFGAAIGTNPPIVIASLFPLPIYFAVYLLTHKPWKERRVLFKILGYCFLIILVVSLLNLFWILPTHESITRKIETNTLGVSPDNTEEWLVGLSQNTSLLNVMRMQGAWVWYSGFGDPYIPYSEFYQTNAFFILLSYLLPLFAFASLFISKNKFAFPFIILSLIGIFLSAGIHPPTGKLYLFLVKHLPLFWIIRSPWYKFSLLTCLGFAVLFGITSQKIYRFFHESPLSSRWRWAGKSLPFALIILLLSFNMIYAYPVTLGKIFPNENERQYLMPFHMEIPQYVNKSLTWLKEKKHFFRVYDCAKRNWQEFTWGYSRVNGHPIADLSAIPVFFNTVRKDLISSPNDEVRHLLGESLYESDLTNLGELFRLFNIEYILQRDDIKYYGIQNWDDVEASIFRLTSQKDISFDRYFGNWNFYKNEEPVLPKIVLSEGPSLLVGDITSLIDIAKLDHLKQFSSFILADQLTPSTFKKVLSHVQSLFFIGGSWNDLILRAVDQKYQLKVPSKDEEFSFHIPEKGTYILWAKLKGDKDLSLVDIYPDDSTEPITFRSNPLEIGKGQYRKLCSLDFKEGKHKLYLYKKDEIESLYLVPNKILEQISLNIKNLISKAGKETFFIYSKHDFSSPANLISKRYVFSKENFRTFSIPFEKSFKVRMKISPKIKMTEEHGWSLDFFKDNIIKYLRFEDSNIEYSAGEGTDGLVLMIDPKTISKPDQPISIKLDTYEPLSLVEYPSFNFRYGLYQTSVSNVETEFWIDFNGDQIVDEKLRTNKVNINLLRMLKKKYPQQDNFNLVSLKLLLHLDQNKLFSDEFKTALYIKKCSFDKLELHELDFNSRNIPILIDGKNYKLKVSSKESADKIGNWFTSGKIFLAQGEHTIQVPIDYENYKIDLIEFSPLKEFLPEKQYFPKFEKIDPTEYITNLDLKSPLLLTFNESFNPKWEASINGKKVFPHIIINGWANGYLLDEPGKYEVKIQFAPQKYFWTGLKLSFLFSVLCLFSLLTLLLLKRKK